jgi:hypothetical protein
MKRLAFLVEGQGDFHAVPNLVGTLASQHPDFFTHLFIDDKPFIIGGPEQFSGRKQSEWNRYLKLAKTRPKLGAVLAVFDGDNHKFEGDPFCATTAARVLAERARAEGAGVQFSLAVVFLRQEYESLLIAAGRQITELPSEIELPGAPEDAPRGAKEWWAKHLPGGYDATRDQRRLTNAVADWQLVSSANRSLRRLLSALSQLTVAVSTDEPVSTPFVIPPGTDPPPN